MTQRGTATLIPVSRVYSSEPWEKHGKENLAQHRADERLQATEHGTLGCEGEESFETSRPTGSECARASKAKLMLVDRKRLLAFLYLNCRDFDKTKNACA